MSEPSIEERKQFWIWSYAHHCFNHVIKSLDFLKASGSTIPDPIRRILTTGIVVTYAKPFTRCDGVKRLPDAVVPHGKKKLHQALIGFRDKMMAHIDAEKFQPDDPNFGNVNQVRVIWHGGRYKPVVVAPDPDLLDVAPDFRQLAQKLLEKSGLPHAEILQKIHRQDPTSGR